MWECRKKSNPHGEEKTKNNFLFDVKNCVESRTRRRGMNMLCVEPRDVCTQQQERCQNHFFFREERNRVGGRADVVWWQEENISAIYSRFFVVAALTAGLIHTPYTIYTLFLTNWNAISHEMSGIYIRTDFPLLLAARPLQTVLFNDEVFVTLYTTAVDGWKVMAKAKRCSSWWTRVDEKYWKVWV